jgi:Predicted thioesterase
VDGYSFSTPIRVRFADTDAQGIAHNSAYLVWFEVARVEYLRAFAGGYQALRDHGIEAIVLESLCPTGSLCDSTTSSSSTRAASACAARASATSTQSREATSLSPTATPSTPASTL